MVPINRVLEMAGGQSSWRAGAGARHRRDGTEKFLPPGAGLPNITNVFYGRDVGYTVERIQNHSPLCGYY
jgi:hypothetical protein